MCTVLIAWRCYRDVPILIAANRDEQRERPSAPPRRLARGVVGGCDLLAGGTWLAVSDTGRVCCVTNRRSRPEGDVHRDPARHSRGEIPVMVLETTADSVAALLTGIAQRTYNPVNVLHASPDAVQVAHLDDDAPPRLVEPTPGPHVLTVRDLDDPGGAKDAHLRAALGSLLDRSPTAAAALAAMQALLGSHHSPSGDRLDAACIHGGTYGTVSASTVSVDAAGAVVFRHAPGPPCITPFEPVAIDIT